MPSQREIDWTFVTGFGLIGALILTHWILCLRRCRFFARGATTYRHEQPGFFWFFMVFELLLLAIVVGGVGLYLRAGGTIVEPPTRSENIVIRL